MHGTAATGGCDKSHLAWRQAPRQRANSQAVARRPSSRRPRPVLSPAARRSHARRRAAPRSRGSLTVYAADAAADISPVAKNDPALVYVPNSMSDTVSVISQRTLKVLRTFSTGGLPQHVTPAWNLKT